METYQSDERLMETSEFVLRHVIQEQLEEASLDGAEADSLQLIHNEDKVLDNIAKKCRRAADTLQRDTELNHAIDSCWPLGSGDSFWRLVEKVFSDGQVSWERIIVLFYIAGKLAVKVVQACVPQTVVDIIKWTLEFLQQRFLSWIREQGGWESVLGFLGTPPLQLLAVFLCGALLGGAIVWTARR